MTLPMTDSGYHHSYTPVGNLLDVFYAHDREVLVCGPAGTGKSRACLEKVVLLALNWPKTRFLIVRKTRESINSSVAVTLKDEVIPHLLSSGVVVHKGSSAKQPAQFEFDNGSVILTAGMDDPEKVKSTDYDMVYANEATELDESDWQMLLTRIRHNKMPDQQLLADCNPSYPYHWLKKRADTGKIRLINTTHHDNPVFWRDGAWTPMGQQYVLGTLASLNGVQRERMYLGKWAANTGLVYDGFNPDVHVIDFTPPASWPRYWSVDFGFTDPFVTQIWAIDADNRMYLEHEVYMTGKTIAEHAKTLKPYAESIRPRMVVCDSASPEGIEQIRRDLRVPVTKAKKDVSVGIGLVKERFKVRDGLPGIFFCKSSLIATDKRLVSSNHPVRTADELLSYSWRKNKPDVPEDEFNHGMDAMRYAVMHLDHRRSPRLHVVTF